MVEYDLTKILSASDLFRDIELVEIDELLEKNTYKIKEYTKNDVFALSGDKVNYLMIVLEGNLITRMVSDSGRYIQIDKIEPGRIVAPAMLFAADNVFPVHVIPEDKASVFFMRKESFLQAMHHNQRLLHNFIRIISDINRFLSTKIHSLSLKTIRGKLAEYILQESKKQGGSASIKLALSRQELADKFAVARQALSRSLSELEDEGLITARGKEIVILDRVGLGAVE